jgi:hypothetical protein
MNKLGVRTQIVIVASLLALTVAFLALKPLAAAESTNALYTGRGDYQKFESQQVNQTYQEVVAPNSADAKEPATGPTSKNCFSLQYHASTDCDRIASQAYFDRVSANSDH